MPSVNIDSEATVLSNDSETSTSIKKSVFSKISEDGWALWIGGLLIVLVLLITFLVPDFKFASPAYQWTNTNELVTKVLSGKNLLLVAGIGFVFAILSSISVRLSGG